MSAKIKVLDAQTGQVLLECPYEDHERAYQFAAEMEELGLDIKIIAPTVNQTLADALGVSGDKLAEFEESLVDEIEDHPGSCCAEPTDPTRH